MVINISSKLFEELHNLENLNYLITNFSENRRYDYFCDIEEIIQTETYISLLPFQKKLIEENYNNIITQSLTPNLDKPEPKRKKANKFVV